MSSDIILPVKLLRRRRRRHRWGIAALCIYSVFFLMGGCASTFLLFATTDKIEVVGAARVEVAVPDRPPVEAYFHPSLSGDSTAAPEGYLLIFDGNGGRAERAIDWGDAATGTKHIEVWAMNYPGFGGSGGSARLSGIAPAALATYDTIRAKAGKKPIVIWGASLGTTAALHVAANRPVDGLILTNPPPLRQLIRGEYGWWNLWILAIPVSLGVPVELDSIANAERTKCPAVFVMAGADTVVPPAFQKKVLEAYAGPKKIVPLPRANHNNPPSGVEAAQFHDEVEALWQSILPRE